MKKEERFARFEAAKKAAKKLGVDFENDQNYKIWDLLVECCNDEKERAKYFSAMIEWLEKIIIDQIKRNGFVNL